MKLTALFVAWLVEPITVPVGIGVGVGVGCWVGVGVGGGVAVGVGVGCWVGVGVGVGCWVGVGVGAGCWVGVDVGVCEDEGCGVGGSEGVGLLCNRLLCLPQPPWSFSLCPWIEFDPSDRSSSSRKGDGFLLATKWAKLIPPTELKPITPAAPTASSVTSFLRSFCAG